MLVEASPALFLKFELTRVTVTHAWFMGYGDFSCLLNELHALPVSPEIFVLVRHALLLGAPRAFPLLEVQDVEWKVGSNFVFNSKLCYRLHLNPLVLSILKSFMYNLILIY